MYQDKQLECMIRLEESVKYIREDVHEIKKDCKEFSSRIESVENVISEHKKYMEEHPQICSYIDDILKRLDKKENTYEIFNKISVFINGTLIIYLGYLGILK